MPGPGMNFELLSSGMDKPFIWSTSSEIHVNPYYEKFSERYLIYDRGLARLGDKNPYTWGR